MRARGFSFIELMLVILVIGILIAMTIPGLKESAMRKQVKEGLPLADVAKRGVEAVYASTSKMPANNADAGVPPADKIIGAFNTAVTVKDGAVTLTYGNNAGDSIKGKKVTLRPAVVPGYPAVPISWICADVPVPPNMELKGANETDIQVAWLPVECRGASAKK
ncbi:Fimbrial protein [Usitatibacter rugosus]|uniref:Fimbrial protein n=1 Tax=Usitatibacter rugosus TaxID=2732067 RepID=A0A6M4GXE6_9PROT|nr:pilin [Usitatibacter rugosus]QJR11969.1 Fimbrial protein [Usitatibacter rugosus]